MIGLRAYEPIILCLPTRIGCVDDRYVRVLIQTSSYVEDVGEATITAIIAAYALGRIMFGKSLISLLAADWADKSLSLPAGCFLRFLLLTNENQECKTFQQSLRDWQLWFAIWVVIGRDLQAESFRFEGLGPSSPSRMGSTSIVVVPTDGARLCRRPSRATHRPLIKFQMMCRLKAPGSKHTSLLVKAYRMAGAGQGKHCVC